MYENDSGDRLTLFVRARAGESETAFRHLQDGSVEAIYWFTGALGYALTGEIGREPLLQAARAAHRGLDQ